MLSLALRTLSELKNSDPPRQEPESYIVDMIDEFRCAKHTDLLYKDWDLYEEWNVSTLIVNQVDQQLHFGDDIEGTTNHNSRKFFFPEQ